MSQRRASKEVRGVAYRGQGHQRLDQEPDMSSVAHSGCVVDSRGRSSRITGLMSSTGVPSIASNSRTMTLEACAPTRRQMVLPMRFGLLFAR